MTLHINETTEAIRTSLDSGNRYAQQGNIGMAIHSYEEALKQNWLLAPAWFNLSLILTVAGDYFHATNAMIRAVRLDPKNPLYWLKKAQLHHLQWDSANALICYEQTIRQNPRDPKPYALASSLLFRHRQTEKALQWCEEGLSVCSPQKEDYRDLLLAHARLQREPETLEEQFTDFNDRELDFLIQFYLSEDRDLANKYLSALIHQNPQFPTVPVYQEYEGKSEEQTLLSLFLDRAESLENQTDLGQSLFLYECAYELALWQEDTETQRFCLEILFDCFQRMHKSSVSFHIGQILLGYLNPEEDADIFAQVVNQIGMLSDHLLCFSQAQELFRLSRELFHKAENVEGMSDALFNLGYSYYYERRFSRALDLLNQFREHPRLGNKAKERVFLIHEHIAPEEIQGDRLLEEGKLEEALHAYQQVLTPRSSQKMSRIYRKLGNLAEEKRALQQTTILEQENYWVFDRLAEIDTEFSVFPAMKTDFLS